MKAQSVYQDETFAPATMHEKQHAIAKPFDRWLGAAVIVAPSIDTDAFGTFTGETARQGTMQDTARAKALAAIEATGLAFGLGSEGSFGPHPAVPFIAAGTEILLCVDQKRRLEVYETLPASRTNYRSLACRPGQDISKYLSEVGFPSHAVVVSPVRGLPCRWCGEPTRVVIAELLRCSKCGIESDRAVDPRRTTADPDQCQDCNP